MNKLALYFIIAVSLTLVACDEPLCGESCGRGDSSLSLNVVTEENVDSVKFWLDSTEICRKISLDQLNLNRGKQGYQGRREQYTVSNGNSNYVIQVCTLGPICDSLELFVNGVPVLNSMKAVVEVFSGKKVDSIQIDDLKWSRQYRISTVSDTLWLRNLDRNNYRIPSGKGTDSAWVQSLDLNHYNAPVCNSAFCVETLKGETVMCIDSLYDDDVFKNACTGGWVKTF